MTRSDSCLIDIPRAPSQHLNYAHCAVSFLTSQKPLDFELSTRLLNLNNSTPVRVCRAFNISVVKTELMVLTRLSYTSLFLLLSFNVFLLLSWCPLKEKFNFWTLSLIIRIFTVIYNVLRHYYDERCSHKSWSSLLTSLLAENNRGEEAFVT